MPVDIGKGFSLVRSFSSLEAELTKGRVFLCQVYEADFDLGEQVELAFKSDVGPVLLSELDIVAQCDEVEIIVLEGGTGLAGGTLPLLFQPNRVVTPTPNTEFLFGTPTSPVTGVSGVAISSPWKLVGSTGAGGNDFIEDTVDIGGFIAAPSLWYQIILRHSGETLNNKCTLSLKFVDPS